MNHRRTKNQERRTDMSQTATVYNFDVELADSDRGVYETLALRVARHPSESEEYLLARLLAYMLEFTEGIEFSRGLCDPDDPGDRGSRPDGRAARVDRHRLARCGAAAQGVEAGAARRGLHPQGRGAAAANLAGERMHRAEAIELYAIDRPFIAALAARLERRMAFSLSINDRELYLSLDDETLTGAVVRHPLA